MAGVADEFVLSDMLERTRHRGPDDSGMYITSAAHSGERVALGNNRLSILDLSPAGHQPMCNEDRTIWVAYNGEIYNFSDLRQELVTDGHVLHSRTDSEILPHLYEKYGTDMVTRLNGMFAFALWDSNKQELWLFRDRLGIKPLYYTVVGKKLYFASEVKALLACPDIQVEMNLAVVPEFLTLLYTSSSETMFKGIQKLSPGHRLRWKGGEFAVEQYWDLEFPQPDSASAVDLSQQFHEVLVSAVRRQLFSDVPVGFFLSGGLDSSTLVACAVECGISDIRCYSIGFRQEDGALEQSDQDARFAKLVAEHFGARFQTLTVDPEVTSLLPKAVYQLDEPLADPAAIATYLISEAAKPEVTVLISGQGADELLGGYRVHLVQQITKYLAHIPAPLRRTVIHSLLPLLARYGTPFMSKGLQLAMLRFSEKLQRAVEMPVEQQYGFLRSYFTSHTMAGLCSEDVLRAGDPLGRFAEHFEACEGEHPLNRLLYVDCKTFLPNLNLAYSDKMTMACSIEARVPFLDNDVIDFLSRVPPALKIKGVTQKYLLRRAFRDSLPASVITRRKAGFGLPIRAWLRNQLREMLHDVLSEKRIREREFLKPATVLRMIEENDSGKQDHTLQLWALLTLELWQQTFMGGSRVSAPVRLAHA